MRAVIYSVLEHLDDSPESIMLEAVLEGMNEFYSRNLSREVMKGMRETALQAKHTGGKPPLGFTVDADTKKLILNPEEAETVQIIFDMYSKGYGYSAILDTLNSQGRKTKRGKPFRKTSLRSILTNPKYQGIYIFNRRSAKDIDGRRNNHLLKSAEEIIFIEGGCPQIIDKETYSRVQKLMSENSSTGGRANAKVFYLLSGKVFCADCGRAMTGNHRRSGRNKSPYTTYRCLNKPNGCTNKEINHDYLERYVVNLLEREFFNQTSLKRIIKRLNKYSQDAKSTTLEDQLKAELEHVNESLQNVADAIASGLVSESVIAKLKDLDEEKVRLENALKNANHVAPTPIDASRILSDYNTVKKSPKSPEYRSFLSNFIERIDVGRYEVKITLNTGFNLYPSLNAVYTVRRKTIYKKEMAQ